MALVLTPEAEQLDALKDTILNQLAVAAHEAIDQNNETQLREATRALQIATDLYPDSAEIQRAYTECLRKLWDIQNEQDLRQRLRADFESNFNSLKAQRKLLEAIYLAVDSSRDNRRYLGQDELENKVNLAKLIEDWLAQGDLHRREEAINALRQELKGLAYEKLISAEAIKELQSRERHLLEAKTLDSVEKFLSSPDNLSPLFNAERGFNKLVEEQPSEECYADARDAMARMQLAIRELEVEETSTLPNISHLASLLIEATNRSKTLPGLKIFEKTTADWSAKSQLLQLLINAIDESRRSRNQSELDALHLNEIRKNLNAVQSKVRDDPTSLHQWKKLGDLQMKLLDVAKNADEELRKKIAASLDSRGGYWQTQIGVLPDANIEFESAWGKMRQWSSSEEALKLINLEREIFPDIKYDIRPCDADGVFEALLAGTGKKVRDALSIPRYGELHLMMPALANKYAQTKDATSPSWLRDSLIAQDTRAAFADSERRNAVFMKALAQDINRDVKEAKESTALKVVKLDEATKTRFDDFKKESNEEFSNVRQENMASNKQLLKRVFILFGAAIVVGVLASLIPWLLFGAGNIKIPDKALPLVATPLKPVEIVIPAGSVFAVGEATTDANNIERYRLRVSSNISPAVLQVLPPRAQLTLENGASLNKDGNGFWELPEAAEQIVFVNVARSNSQPASGAQVNLYQRQNKIYRLLFSSLVIPPPSVKPSVVIDLPKAGVITGADTVITLTSSIAGEGIIKLPGEGDIQVNLPAGLPLQIKIPASHISQPGKASILVGGEALATFEIQQPPGGVQVTELPMGQMILTTGKIPDTIVLTYTIVNTGVQPLNINALIEVGVSVFTQPTGVSVTASELVSDRIAVQALLTSEDNWSGFSTAFTQTIKLITPTQPVIIAELAKQPFVLLSQTTLAPEQTKYWHVFVTAIDAKGNTRSKMPISVNISLKNAQDGKDLFRNTEVFEFDGTKFVKKQ